MATLRETLQAEIAAAETDVAEKKAQLAAMEGTASDFLGREVDALKSFFASIARHLGL